MVKVIKVKTPLILNKIPDAAPIPNDIYVIIMTFGLSSSAVLVFILLKLL